jgi:hypothetical protein
VRIDSAAAARQQDSIYDGGAFARSGSPNEKPVALAGFGGAHVVFDEVVVEAGLAMPAMGDEGVPLIEKISQIMSLLNLAPDVQEAILFLFTLSHAEGPKTVRGRDPVCAREVIALAAEVDWGRQRQGWGEIPISICPLTGPLDFTHQNLDIP